MKLTITAHLGQATDGSQAAIFPARGGSIGHHRGNTLVLENHHGTIAGRHASVYRGVDGWRIAPEPGASVAINGHAVSHGQEWPLQVGDVLEVGGYQLSPEEVHSAWSGLSPEPSPVVAPPPTAETRPHPLHRNVTQQPASADPLADIESHIEPGDLQNTSLDPLALFAADHFAAQATELDDPLLSGFERSPEHKPADAGFGASIPDAVPEHLGHLRMEMEWPESTSVPPAQSPEPPPTSTASQSKAGGLHSSASSELVLAFQQGLGSQCDDWPSPELMHLLGSLLRVVKSQV